MTRALAILAGVCAALASVLALWLPPAEAVPAPEVVRVAEFLRTRDEPVAGLSLAFDGDEQRLVYARSRGLWRCLSVWNAPADGAAIELLLADLVDARGVLRAAGPGARAEFGLLGAGSLDLRLHGRKLLEDEHGDVLLQARFGAPSQVGGVLRARAVGAFASLGDDERVLELGFEPARALGAASPNGLPPLLALRVGPPGFPAPGERVVRAFLDHADGTSIELVRAERVPLPPEPGLDPNLALDFEWALLDEQGQQPIPPVRGEAYTTFAPRAPYDLLADPREFASYGLATPELKLTLVPSAGEPLVLEVSAEDVLGNRWVLCRSTPQLARVSPELAGMLVPDRATLSDAAIRNAWDAWLRAAIAQPPR